MKNSIKNNKNIKIFKLADVFLIIIILISAFFGAYYINHNKKLNNNIIIKVDGQIFGEYDLNCEQEINIYDNNYDNNANNIIKNIIKIENNTAKMIYANCPDGLCLRQKLSSNNIIACLPNRVTIELEELEENNYNSEIDVFIGG